MDDPAALPSIRTRIENRSDLSSKTVLRLSSTRDKLKKREKELAKGG